MKYGDFDKAAYLGWMLGKRSPANQPEEDEMHCCDNCKKYELNDGDCIGWGIDSAEDNHCRQFERIL
jgi:hypothetical protein